MDIGKRVGLLKIGAASLLIIPGVLMVLGPVTPSLGLVEMFLDFAWQPLDNGQNIDTQSAFLLNAILGGVLAGFGIMIWQVAEHVFRNDQALGRKLILVPLFSWFVMDSAGSVMAGAWFNAVINVVILAILAFPVALPQK